MYGSDVGIKEFLYANIHHHRIIAKSSDHRCEIREIRADAQAEINQNQKPVISATAGGGLKSPKSRLAG
eukprot:2352638-Prymnesium_polylepis.1